ncbi:DUF4115 domain-containing protein [Thalassotalea sp. M1531]|uniref:DUF4115 domain-containing protein n=1 Tax=Thalassotalea algicola TaxID=2716224 RepID=A0A7Y0Q768_9GAMM|nr:RodZ domain-containing protein [Thalassotalea algicola]NMP32163.1 DUF4115 domain-containing protein [Thalassotalea algicola]
MSKKVKELPEDIEVIGPGQMLAEARDAMGLTQKEVAAKLNFRVALVDEIEHELFDKSLPDTFNRGYLKNYAKLVGVSEQDVLASYEMLGVAAKQRTEMQSFSKITEKQAQNSRLMWITYLILAALVASSILYYLQDIPSKAATKTVANTTNSKANTDETAQPTEKAEELPEQSNYQPESTLNTVKGKTSDNVDDKFINQPEEGDIAQAIVPDNSIEPVLEIITPVESSDITAIFSFAGDCWVNIYDGNGERIAWGIKKAGYVMELKGVAPFKVTVGKPELVAIDFNGESIDMSKFNVGNIAKFTLPESP